MSSSIPGQTSTPSSDFKSILDDGLSQALSEYKKKTGKSLLDHPLAAELQRCASADAIKAIFRVQAETVQRFRNRDQKLTKWIDPVVDVLYTFSDTLGGVAGIAFPPARAIFTAIGVLLTAAIDVRASHDALVELFDPIKDFFERLGVYTQIPLTAEMAEVFVKIVAEILSILSIATKEVERKRAKIYFRYFVGRTDIEDGLKKLNNLIQKEVPMAIAQTMMDVNDLKWNQIEQDFRNWFTPPDPSTNHSIACGVYHNAQPTWFFEAGVLKDWTSNGSLLWVHGKPGSGKSVLCAAIIQHIMTLRDSGKAQLAYFYFDFRDEEKQSIRNAVTSLLIQLSAYSKPCRDIIHRLHSAHGKGTQHPSDGILIDRLEEMLTVTAQQQPVFIVMDALDECPDDGSQTPREDVLRLVKVLVNLRLPNLHICVTSRPEIDIQNNLKPLAVNAISLHEEAKQKTVIASYVSSVISSDECMRDWRDGDKKLVVEELSERADGMFQWVFCQLETLRHVVQPDVRVVLERLPKTLDETYERVLKDIKEDNQEHARRLLHCIAVAVRPLRVEELAEILTFDFDTAQGGIPKFHPDRRPSDQEEAVLSLCSSLLTVVDDRGSRVVQFSHFSVKEFLTSNHLPSLTGYLTRYHILPEPAHTILAQVCLGILLHFDDSNGNKSVKDSPLAEYAARHWIAHARYEDVALHVDDGIKALFDPEQPHFAAWIGLYDIDAESDEKSPLEIPSPLYYSTLCGLYGLVRHIANKHPEHVNAIGGSYGFPLVAALCRNHFPVADLLLKHGGRVNVRDTRLQTALYKTIYRHGKVALEAVRFLLDHGADVNTRRDDLWTPLHLSVNVGELSAVRMLLEHQADVNSRNDAGQAPLHLLSTRETAQNEDDGSDIAKLLLERGANVNEKDNDNATPLHLASYNQRLTIVRVLLEHGANVDAVNAQGKTPLQLTFSKGIHETQEDGVDVALLLLEHGAQLYAQDRYHISTSDLACCIRKEKSGQIIVGSRGKSEPDIIRDRSIFRLWVEECGVDGKVQDKYDTILIHSASYHGNLETVRVLLSHGVKLNAKNHWGETALHIVSRDRCDSKDSARVVRLLLEHGLDVNTQDKDGNFPLHAASYSGKFGITRALLNHGAEATAKNDRDETPLHQVAQGEYESQTDGVRVAKSLLDRGVDVNTQDKNGVTPLHLASWCGKLELTKLFLERATLKNNRVRTLLLVGAKERPMDSNVQRKDQETPLHFACFRGKSEIARMLLDHGAQVNAKNDHGETALHLVSRAEYESPDDGVRIAQLLLERGIDVNAQDRFHWTSLHSASNNGKPEVLQVLLSHGGNVNAENELGETPLHLVRQRKYGSQDGVQVVRLLLNGGADVNARDKREWTPLHTASYYGRLEILQMLLDRCGIAAAENDEGKTPLHEVSQGNFEFQEAAGRVAELLLERGVDANSRDKNRETPLHVASRCGRLGIVLVLLRHATKKNALSQTSSHLGLEWSGADVNALNENNGTPLHSACYSGRFEIVQLLLEHGANVNATDESGNTPLHRVSQGIYDSEEAGVGVARLLLERGAHVNVRRKDGITPLHIASDTVKLEVARLLLDHGANVDATCRLGGTSLHLVSHGQYDSEIAGVAVARLLLERGADVNARREDDVTPLHLASEFGKPEITRLLLKHGAKVDATTALLGSTPLHQVSMGEYNSEESGIGVARLLLEHGADVDARNEVDSTSLHVASRNGKLEITRLLLDHGAIVDVTLCDVCFTPLHLVSVGQYDSEIAGVGIARLLLERGADVNVQSKDDVTPLHLASCCGKLEIARLLLDHGAKVDASTAEFGATPLHNVLIGKYPEDVGVAVTRLLLERGADVNARRKDNTTPLHLSSDAGKLEITRILLDHGAEVNASAGTFYQTPLHNVLFGKYPEEAGVGVAWLLLERGADVNARRKDDCTPLHLASELGKLEITQLLLDHGANVDATTALGSTPLHQVSHGKYDSEIPGVDIARLLLERGADVNARRKDDYTPLHLASELGKLEITRLLLNKGATVNASAGTFYQTPLHNVLFGKYPEDTGVGIAQLLLERGADVNARLKDDVTPLHLALQHGKLEITRLLLKHGAKVDATTALGSTPLHQVSHGKYDSEMPGVDIARLLLDSGADVSARRKDDWTPLHVASFNGNVGIARALIDHGASVDVLDKYGKTPLHDVSRGEYDSEEAGVGIARLLLEHGANVNAKAKFGSTPLDLASKGRPKLAQFLRENVVRPSASRVRSVSSRGNSPSR